MIEEDSDRIISDLIDRDGTCSSDPLSVLTDVNDDDFCSTAEKAKASTALVTLKEGASLAIFVFLVSGSSFDWSRDRRLVSTGSTSLPMLKHFRPKFANDKDESLLDGMDKRPALLTNKLDLPAFASEMEEEGYTN